MVLPHRPRGQQPIYLSKAILLLVPNDLNDYMSSTTHTCGTTVCNAWNEKCTDGGTECCSGVYGKCREAR